jgi:O-antigen ligase
VTAGLRDRSNTVDVLCATALGALVGLAALAGPPIVLAVAFAIAAAIALRSPAFAAVAIVASTVLDLGLGADPATGAYLLTPVDLTMLLLALAALRRRGPVEMPYALVAVTGVVLVWMLIALAGGLGSAHPRSLEIYVRFAIVALIVARTFAVSDVTILLGGLALLGLFESLLALIQVTFAGPLGLRERYADLVLGGQVLRPVGTFEQPNVLGAVLTLTLFATGALRALAGDRARTVVALALALQAVAIVMTLSRGAIAATAVGLAVVLVSRGRPAAARRARWPLAIVTGLPALLIVAVVVFNALQGTAFQRVLVDRATFDPATRSNVPAEERTKAIRLARVIVSEHPVFGLGPGNWVDLSPRFTAGAIDPAIYRNHPHNVYLLATAESGLPGGAAFTLMLLGFALAGFRRLRRAVGQARAAAAWLAAGCLAYAVASLVDVFFTRGIDVLFGLMAGGALVLTRARTT